MAIARTTTVLVAWFLLAPGAARAGALDPVDLALGKAARQSSTLFGADATRAVDGNQDGQFWDGSVTHTDFDLNAWWEVDLGSVQQIGQIEIANRTDCCGDRLSPFMVIVADIPIIDSDITDADAQAYPGIMRTRITAGPQDRYRIPINRSGRYVRVALLSQNYLHLAEVMVFEGRNLARGRTVTQSSTASGGDASHAVDGNTDGTFGNGSVAATNYEYHASWQVDLGAVHPIREIDVWNATTCCSTAVPRPGFFIFVSENPITVDPITTAAPGVVGFYNGTVVGSPIAFPTISVSARYVMIESEATDSLSLAEVQVFGVGRGAQGGHASQSSTVAGDEAARAIDDIADGTSGSSTQNQLEPYWDVDLGAHRYLETVKLWSMAGNTTSLDTYNLFVSDSDFLDANFNRVTTVAGTRALPGVSSWVVRGPLTSSVTAIMRGARFVRVMLDGVKTLTMSEVEILTSEGFVRNSDNGTAENSDPLNRQAFPSGYAAQPNVPIVAYAFVPNTSTGGGTSVLAQTVFSAAGAELTPYSATPLYPWQMWFALPDYGWPQGGVGSFHVEAYNGVDGVTAPLPNFNADGTENLFWPESRLVSSSVWTTPDWDSTPPPYLDSPQGTTNQALDYYAYFKSYIPPTLAGFTSKYFTDPSNTYANAPYYGNHGDLGIGRSMHCSHHTSLNEDDSAYTACYVNNYGPIDELGNPNFGTDATDGNLYLNGVRPAATVAMWTNFDGVDDPVTFAVYNADGNLSPNAALDNTRHNTAVPNNCMTCHNGSGSFFAVHNPKKCVEDVVHGVFCPRIEGMTNGTFLPFDPSAFSFIDQPGYRKEDLEESFRQLNAIIATGYYVGENLPPAVSDFLTGSYGGFAGLTRPGTVMNLDYVPAGWLQTPAQKRIYQKVIKPYCRACHMSQIPASGGVNFLKADDADALRALLIADVCVTHRMPHAEQSLINFWTSGARAEVLGYFGRHDFPGELCKP